MYHWPDIDSQVAAVLMLASSIALPFLVKSAIHWQGAADTAQQQLNVLQRQLASEAQARDQLEQWQTVRAQWQGLSSQAERLGWRTGLWDVRSIEVDGKRFSRLGADTLIASLASGGTSFMLPRSFSMKLLDEQGSLFIASPGLDRRDVIHLSLSGDYYSLRTP